MKNFLKKIVPVGFNYKAELTAYLVTNFIAVLYSFDFFNTFASKFAKLYTYDINGNCFIRANAVMEYFYSIIKGKFKFFLAVVIVCIVFVVLHYVYHYYQSKSIYLMKRLPDKNLLHKRCLLLPLLSLIFSGVLIAVLTGCYYLYYMKKTPEQCLLPGQLGYLFKNLLWRIPICLK